MKLIHTARHPAEAHLIKGMLEAEGIRADVKNDVLFGAFGDLPVLPTVWVRNAELGAYAERLVNDFLRGTAAKRYAHLRWTCAECGEALEGQFTACWKCGMTRPDL